MTITIPKGEITMINLTPHDIVIQGKDDKPSLYPASGKVARVVMEETVIGTFAGVDVITRKPGLVEGLPEDGTPCLVSAMVLSAIPPGTPGVYAPDTGPTAIRDKTGQVKAVTRLAATI